MQRDGFADQGTAMKRLTATAAHHSRAHYTGPMRELQGEVVRLRWGNPLLAGPCFLQSKTYVTGCLK